MAKSFFYFVFAASLFFAFIGAESSSFDISTRSSLSSGFIENRGQVINQFGEPNNSVKYILNTNGFKIYLRENGFSYDLFEVEKRSKTKNALKNDYSKSQKYVINSHRVDVFFIGANSNPKIITEGKSSDYLNYYNCGKEGGVTYVYQYERIIYKDIYPKIDLAFEVSSDKSKHKTSKIKYNFVVRPGGKVKDIKLKYEGMTSLKRKNCSLFALETNNGNVNEEIEESYIVDDFSYFKTDFIEQSNKIDVAYDIDGKKVKYKTDEYDESKTLVIDPNIVWGTYYGSQYQEYIYGLTVDYEDNIIGVGTTYGSSSIIATEGAHQTTFGGNEDGIIFKFDSNGKRLWGSYYGDYGTECFYAAGNDYNNNILLAGHTSSPFGIASPEAHQTSSGGGGDAFIVKLTPDGILQWATYYGGSSQDFIYGITSDRNNNVIAVGTTPSRNKIASVNAYQANFGGGNYDVFLAKFKPDGERLWGTYYGGYNLDGGTGHRFRVVCNKSNDIYFSGYTESFNNIATSNAYNRVYSGNGDAYLAKFSESGDLKWATYFGGSNYDRSTGIALDSNENIVVTGITGSSNGISLSGKSTLNGTRDAYIAKFTSSGNLVFSEYFGGEREDYGIDVAVCPNGYISLSGWTNSLNSIASSESYQPNFQGARDSYVALFGEDLSYYSGTYVGGEANDLSFNLKADSRSDLYLIGNTASINHIATSNAFQTNFNGNQDGFLVKLRSSSCDETAFDYRNFTSIDNLNLVGNAFEYDSAITLTPSDFWKGGAVWTSIRVPVKKGFTTEFSFKFSEGNQDASPLKEQYAGADGIAFVVQNQSPQALGRLGKGIGYSGMKNCCVIEYDTYNNNDMEGAGFSDPGENHIGVFSAGLSQEVSCNHNSETEVESTSSIMPIIPDGRTYYSKIEYNVESSKRLSIYLDSTEEFRLPPVLVVNDFQGIENIELEQKEFAWVGFTSGTGNSYEKHELESWYFCPMPTSAILSVDDSRKHENEYFRVYPNPTSNVLNIEYFLNKASFVEIRIVDLMGRTVDSIKRKAEPKGEFKITVNVSKLNSGAYSIVLNTGSSIEAESIILMR